MRFICTPPKTSYQHSLRHYLEDEASGWKRFKRSLISKVTRYDDTSTQQEDYYLPKFAVKSRIGNSSFAEHDNRLHSNADMFQLDQYLSLTERSLKHSVMHLHHKALAESIPRNHSTANLKFLRQLQADDLITIKPADKNLGMAMVDTEWYNNELKRMLADKVTYQRVSEKEIKQLSASLIKDLHKLVKCYEGTIHTWRPNHADQIIKYLKDQIKKDDTVIPAIYLLIKVHKSSLCGRPIVPCTKWVTQSAAVVVDDLLQEIVTAANIPWLVKDTKSFVNELESIVLPTKDGIFVTADIASLYTNIDTKMGLQLVEKFLIWQHIDHDRIEFIMALLKFVMNNSYLVFRDTFYKQIDGTAMGTPPAPVYANIVVFMLERSVLEEFQHSLHLYRRFLDDIFAYIDAAQRECFEQRMNSLHPKLKFEFTHHCTEAAFLDLHIYKGERFQQQSIVDLRVHQKKLNMYLYIPFRSFHTTAMKKAFILTELMRYIRNSSSFNEYMDLKSKFYQRLRDRGYPNRFLDEIFNSILYHDRRFFLMPSSILRDAIQSSPQPPVSSCLLKRIARQARQTQITAQESTPPVFIIPYSPLSHFVPTRKVLLKFWEMFQHLRIPRPIIAYQSCPSLMRILVFQKTRKMEQERKKKLFAPIKAKQQSLSSYFGPRAPLK